MKQQAQLSNSLIALVKQYLKNPFFLPVGYITLYWCFRILYMPITALYNFIIEMYDRIF